MGKVRVADYIAEFLHETLGIKDVFLVTGGGAMFLNDGVAKQAGLNAICNHHEQASAMAAVAYAKCKNSYAAVMTTSGCGATNAVTGLLDAWQDSTPVIFLSGQVKRKETVYNSTLPLRQAGVQEANIIPIVESISKYAVMVNEPEKIAYYLEKSAYIATSGRPGPVWLDIPQDVQGSIVEKSDMIHFDTLRTIDDKDIIDDKDVLSVVDDLAYAQRPVIIAGNGVRLSGAGSELQEFYSQFQIPVTTSYLGLDIITSTDPFYVGRLGLKGDRAGNFAVQNSDLLIVLGSRLAVGLTGFEYELFARDAKIVVIDIDSDEHKKNNIKIDKFIHADVRSFLIALNVKKPPKIDREFWRLKCIAWREKWPVALDEYQVEKEKVNIYTFVDHLSKYTKDTDIIVADAGSAYYVTAQAIQIKGRQRYITSGAQADMGFSIPAAIGASIATNHDVLAITGDGSFQMNIQELQTIVHYQLPIKFFILNNNGYLSIRTTQSKFFEGRLLGTNSDSGISFPDLKSISEAYKFEYFCIKCYSDLDETLAKTMACSSPVICEVMCPEYQEIVPTVSSLKRDDGTMVSKPIEDMYPFLSRDEFQSQMIVKPVEE